MADRGFSSHQNWNISKHDEHAEPSPHEAALIDQVFPMRTFSSLGGGDAPLINKVPKLRSRLFTISTRSVLASHSQVNVSYTTSTSVDADGMDDGYIPIPRCTSPQMDLEFENGGNGLMDDDVKPLNTDSRQSLCSSSPQQSPSICSEDMNENEPRFNIMTRQCFHSSLEDLREKPAGSLRNSKESGKDRRKSAPVTSSRGQMIEAANELLVDENKHLRDTIRKIQKKFLVTKVALGFIMEGVKRRGKLIKRLEVIKLEKEQQCAARLILHSLLLNSWRNTKRELDMRIDDNTELRKSVENFSLQVQVLRHIQTSERQKAQEKTAIIESLNEELGIVKEENLIMRKEIEKMESKLNSLQASTQNLSEENEVLNKEITKITDNRDTVVQSLDRERVRSEQFRRDNETMKETLKHLESQLKEATESKSHWQERARCSESEAWELQMHLETRDSNIKDLTRECHSLREDKMMLMEEKSNLKTDLDRTTTALKTLGEKSDDLMELYEKVKIERDGKATLVEELAQALERKKKESKELERELMSYKLHNVRRRREWGNALYFVVSPMDAVRRKWT